MAPLEDNEGSQRGLKRMTSPERFEIAQLIAAGVLDRKDFPGLDQDAEEAAVEEGGAEEEVEIELVEEEPAFLRGHSKESVSISPVRIVKNPDGSLQRAAMTQSSLAKERREVKTAQKEAALPADFNDPWMDPMNAGNKGFAQDAKSSAAGMPELPAWKKASMGGAKVTRLNIAQTKHIKSSFTGILR